jgi:dihydroorotate dehydrogenase
MLDTPFYDPKKTYEENFKQGPFGALSNNEQITKTGLPTHNFLGQKIYLPFGISAGPLLNGRFVTAALQKGFDLCVYKTVRTSIYPCHAWPNILGVKIEGDLTLKKAKSNLKAEVKYCEPLSITNSFGVPSMDPDWWQADMAKTVANTKSGQVMIGSFQGTKREGGSVNDLINDYVLAARLVKETGAKILEANLSCPNEGTANLLCFDTPRVRLIVEKIKNEIGNTPLILKLAYFPDQLQLRTFIKEIGSMVDGLSAINTIAAPIVTMTEKQALPGKGRLNSGVCGAAIKWAGLEMVERIAKLRQEYQQNFALIGVGGVCTAEDYFMYIQAGADAVMSTTGAIWHPLLAQEILNYTCKGEK